MRNKVIRIGICLVLAMLMLVGCGANTDKPANTTEPVENIPESSETIMTEPTEAETEPTHTHEFETTTVEATCETDGYTQYTCACGYEEIRDKVSAFGHDFEVETVAATYTEKGYDVKTCKVCGIVVKDNETDIIPHEHKYEKKVTKPTCTKKGYTTHTCSLCGNSYKDSETKKIAHDYSKKITNPTCTKDGYTTYTCKACKKSYKDNVVAATGHTYTTETIAPTYLEKGYDLHKCSACGDSYKDNYTEVMPHEHVYTEKVIAPTCVDAGYTMHTCTICSHQYKDNETVALGHSYVTETVKPTAKEKGYDLHKCSRCGDSYKDNYTDPVVTYKEVNETVYAKSDVNIRKGPGTSFEKLDSLAKGKSITRVGIGDNGWSKVKYNDTIAYISSNYLTTEKPPVVSENGYPKTYSDSTCTITVYKEWWENAYVYAAHVQFTDYDRMWVECANGKYNSGRETTSHAAKRVGAILAINGDYAVPGNGAGGYAIARKGKVCNDKKAYPEGVYNSNTGKLTFGHSGRMLSELVAEGLVTDTFQFGPVFLKDGKIIGDKNSSGRAQRTFIGTNGKPGDIWMCVSDGRKNDGKSSGLNGYQCGSYLVSKGCTLGVPLDGGGSSTMYFNGKVLNAAKGNQRAVADFLVFK